MMIICILLIWCCGRIHLLSSNIKRSHLSQLVASVSFNTLVWSSICRKLLPVLVVAERSTSPTPPHPHPPLSSHHLQQQQWANRCLRKCPLLWPSCQNPPAALEASAPAPSREASLLYTTIQYTHTHTSFSSLLTFTKELNKTAAIRNATQPGAS